MKSNVGLVLMGFFLIAVCVAAGYILLSEPADPAAPSAPGPKEKSAPEAAPEPARPPMAPAGERRTARTPPWERIKGRPRSREANPADRDRPEEPPPPEKGGRPIMGKVVDEGGNPIAEATVELGAVLRRRTEVTGPNGLFQFDNVAPGKYPLKVYKALFAPAEIGDVEPGMPRITFVLEAQSTISGRVVSASSRAPLKNFKLAVFPVPPPQVDIQSMRATLPWRVFQDPGGHFLVENVPNDTPLIVAGLGEGHAMGYIEVEPIPLTESLSDVVVYLPIGGRVMGRVCDPRGSAIADAAIHVGARTTGVAEAHTDAQGRFEVTTISPDDTVLTASRSGYAPSSVEITTPGRVTIVMERGGMIEGMVTQGGKPVPGIPVNAQMARQAVVTARNGETDMEGHYRLTGFPDGEAVVRVLSGAGGAPEQARWIMQRAEVKMGQARQVNFEIPEVSAQIEGEVLLEGQAPATGHISVEVKGDGGEVMVAVSVEPDGHYVVENLPAGSVTMRVSVQGRDGAQRWKTAHFRIGEGQTVQQDFEFTPEASIVGTVSGMTPGETATVMAAPGEHGSGPLTQELLAKLDRSMAGLSAVEAGGRFRIEGLEAGTYTLAAFSHANTVEGMRSALRTLHVAPGMETQVTLTLH